MMDKENQNCQEDGCDPVGQAGMTLTEGKVGNDQSVRHGSLATTHPVPKPRLSVQRRKAAVLLLGRGNSFSLGRSEAMVINGQHGNSNTDVLTNRCNHSDTSIRNGMAVSEEKCDSSTQAFVDGGDCDKSWQLMAEIGEGQTDAATLQGGMCQDASADRDAKGWRCPPMSSPSPPPISNGLDLGQREDSVVSSASQRVLDLTPCWEEELEELWHHAESVMYARQDGVCRVLEEYGIGQPGGGGGEYEEEEGGWRDQEEVEERKKEEEEMWRMVQDSLRVA